MLKIISLTEIAPIHPDKLAAHMNTLENIYWSLDAEDAIDKQVINQHSPALTQIYKELTGMLKNNNVTFDATQNETLEIIKKQLLDIEDMLTEAQYQEHSANLQGSLINLISICTTSLQKPTKHPTTHPAKIPHIIIQPNSPTCVNQPLENHLTQIKEAWKTLTEDPKKSRDIIAEHTQSITIDECSFMQITRDRPSTLVIETESAFIKYEHIDGFFQAHTHTDTVAPLINYIKGNRSTLHKNDTQFACFYKNNLLVTIMDKKGNRLTSPTEEDKQNLKAFLADFHADNGIHGDIKPDHIFKDDKGKVFIIDPSNYPHTDPSNTQDAPKATAAAQLKDRSDLERCFT